jgi:hypothetical protein
MTGVLNIYDLMMFQPATNYARDLQISPYAQTTQYASCTDSGCGDDDDKNKQSSNSVFERNGTVYVHDQ